LDDRIPVGRFGTPQEVADMALAASRNPFLTRQTLQIYGGIYMT
jgi:3-oxoacyl-[acyl-carrier protein] reductase